MTNGPLYEFLNQRKAEKGGECSHTLIAGKWGGGGGSFFVDPHELPTLYNLLHKAITIENRSPSLTEKPTEFSCLRIDVDLKYSDSSGTKSVTEIEERQYTSEHVMNIISSYNRVLTRYFDIEEDAIVAYVMERDAPYTMKGVTKDGIHIMYPNVVMSKSNQKHLRKWVLPDLKVGLSDLLERNALSVEQVIDEAIITNGWLLYGCSKPNVKPYLLTRVFDYAMNDITDEVDTNVLTLVNTLKVNYSGCSETAILKDFTKRIVEVSENNSSKSTRKPIIVQEAGAVDPAANDKVPVVESGNDLKEARQLASLLSSKRADAYQTWIEVGLCLHNISPELEDAWLKFSQKSQKYDEDHCLREWAGMRWKDKGLNIGSLHLWAKQDNPEEYSKVIRPKLDHLIKRASSCLTQDVAVAIKELHKGQFVSTDGGGKKSDKVWYEFVNHRWHECDGRTRMQWIMGTSLQDQCASTIVRINEQRALLSADDSELKQRLDEDSDRVSKLRNKLKDSAFKTKVYSECVWLFYDDTFFLKLDENIDLIGCENGIYNLRTGEFRDGMPEDYVSLSTGVKYQTEDEFGSYKDPEHVLINQINRFFEEIQVNSNVRQYLKILLGACLYGRNINEKFYVLEGCGSNGKSKLIELLELALGPYASHIASNYFTEKRVSSSSASPDVEFIAYARVVTSQETEEGEKFNIAKVKSLSGNDKITFRGLYKSTRCVRPKFNILMAVNHMPALPSDDEGIWRRLRVIKFLSRFVDQPDINNKYEFKKDPLLASKFEQWKAPFLYLLIEWHRKFRQEGLQDIDEVMEATRKCQQINDQYAEFFNYQIIDAPDDYVSVDSLVKRFREWWPTHGDGKVAPIKEFKSKLFKRLGEPEKTHRWGAIWKGKGLYQQYEIPPTELRITDRKVFSMNELGGI